MTNSGCEDVDVINVLGDVECSDIGVDGSADTGIDEVHRGALLCDSAVSSVIVESCN